MNYDLVINHGTVIDGTGKKRFKGNLGIRDGIIETISEKEELKGKKIIDASNRIVAPGFIDMHSHSDWVLVDEEHQRTLGPFITQGVTTVVGGNCGFSPSPVTEESKFVINRNSAPLYGAEPKYDWHSTEEYLSFLEGQGVYFNTAILIGHNTLRALVAGNSQRKLSEEELSRLSSVVRQSLTAGAFGLSMGLAYVPGIFADDQEILSLLNEVSERNGIWTFHGHTYSWTSPFYRPKYFGKPHNIRDLERLLEIARQAGVRTNVSHLIFKGRYSWKTYRQAIAVIEKEANSGLDVAFDAIPYHWGNSLINILFPKWFLDSFLVNIKDKNAVRKLKREVGWTERLIGRSFQDIYLLWGGADDLTPFEGLSFAEISSMLNISEVDAYIYVAKESGGRAKILTASYSGEEGGYEEPLYAVLSNPLCAFILDSLLTDIEGPQNPASSGGFPRILGRFCRDLDLFSLEEAVRRMTYFPAQRIGLEKTGRIAEGYWGDIVVFDADTVRDNTTLKHPNAKPSGMEAVLVSGNIVVEHGNIVSETKYGRVIRKA